MFNPMFDEFQKQWEKMMLEWFEKTMNSPEFLKSMGNSFEGAFSSKAVIDECKARMLKSMSLPSEESISRLGSYILRMDSKLLDLEDRLAEFKQDLAEIKNAVKKESTSSVPEGVKKAAAGARKKGSRKNA